jgi:hypothetical protein
MVLMVAKESVPPFPIKISKSRIVPERFFGAGLFFCLLAGMELAL